MNQLSLLRDYVATMERQLESKNNQLNTLTLQNKKLIAQIQQYSIKKSFVLNPPCEQCLKNKKELLYLQSLSNQLQFKYSNLEKSTKQNNITHLGLNNAPCSECSRIKQQDKSKDDLILNLKSQISEFNTKVFNLQGQIYTLKASASKPIVYTQTSSQNDLQRITYLNGQVEQYIALMNSLRSEIKILSQENQRYNFKLRQLQCRPPIRQIQYVQKQISSSVREQIRALKIQIGELSNDNMLLRRQNAALKREVLNLPKNGRVISQNPQADENYRSHSPHQMGKHFKKSMVSNTIPNTKSSHQIMMHNNNFKSNVFVEKLPYQQKIKYDDLQRKIQLLQMENDYLKGNFYSQI